MKKRIITTFIVLTTVAIAVLLLFRPARLAVRYYLNDCPAEGPQKETDFAVYSEPVDLEEYRRSLVAYADISTMSVADKVTFGPSSYDVFDIAVGNARANKRLLIIATVHGNEFVSALAILDVLQDVRLNRDFYEEWSIRVLTPVNPVGLSHNSRYNEDGCDINRDFRAFATAGARIQRDIIEEFRPQVIVSLHEGPQDGFFVIADQPTPDGLRQAIIRQLKSNNIALATTHFLGIPISDSGLWYKPRSVYAMQKALGIHTLGRFAHELGVIALTTESPWSNHDVALRRKPHLIVIRSVVEEMARASASQLQSTPP